MLFTDTDFLDKNIKRNPVHKCLNTPPPQIKRIVLCILPNISWKVRENPYMRFPVILLSDKQTNKKMKGQSEIAYLPKFANMMLIVMVIVITEILCIILIFDCFENQ